MSSTRITLIAMPYHCATPEVGMGLGPKRLVEEHELARVLERSAGEVQVEVLDAPDPTRPEIARTFDLARRLAKRVGSLQGNRIPLVISGDCNSCLGTVAGLQPTNLGVVWFDAHADFDTPEDNLSGFLDVMSLAALTGSCWRALRNSIPSFRVVPERDVVLVGVRDLAPYQRVRLQGSRIRAIYGEEVRSKSIEAALKPALDDLPARRGSIYLHVDLDVLDPSEGHANEYAAPGGLSLDELKRAIELVGVRFEVRGAALTAYNPELDPHGRVADAALRIAETIARAAGA